GARRDLFPFAARDKVVRLFHAFFDIMVSGVLPDFLVFGIGIELRTGSTRGYEYECEDGEDVMYAHGSHSTTGLDFRTGRWYPAARIALLRAGKLIPRDLLPSRSWTSPRPVRWPKKRRRFP